MTAAPSSRTELRRLPERAAYDRDAIHAILDEGYLCHVGIVDGGTPVVIPTLYARDGDSILIHGSPASRTLRTAATDGVEICVTVTLVDGFVIGRSGFHHSMNYRSVVAFGEAVPVTGDEERRRALDLIVDRILPGQAAAARPITRNEVKGTVVLRLPLTEASAKVRSGGPQDEPEDYALPIWAGVIPVRESYGAPIPDPELTHDLPVPDHLTRLVREGRRAESAGRGEHEEEPQ
jgi:nitroimidazol reductase NimA-like FMN-containing flavoprotein (pyridoxamine 5'-phosphate oxidase superfamily)